MREEEIKSSLTAKFPFLDQKVAVPRARRIVIGPLGRADFKNVFDYLVREAGFNNFHMIAGMQTGDDLEFLYMLSDEDHILLVVKLLAPIAEPVVDSVMSYFPNALWHEREIIDLLGAVIEGLPPGPSYPLPDNWPKGNYPLRKDWRPEYFDRTTLTYNPPAPQSEPEETAAAEVDID